jgi:hypothetical protein
MTDWNSMDTLNAILDRYETDADFVHADAADPGAVRGTFMRLQRAVSNQLDGGQATFPRYAIWAETVEGQARNADGAIEAGDLAEARRLLRLVANSLGAFAEVQKEFERMGVNATR